MASKAKENLTQELTTGIPAWAKGVFWVALIGGGGYLVYRLVKGSKGIVQKLKENAELKKEVTDDPKGLSYNAAVYTQLADRLFAALNGTFGEDEPAFEPVFAQIKTRADLAELIRVYGRRDVSWRFPAQSLNEAITEFFWEDEKQQYILTPLNRNGVNYTGLI